MLLLLLLLLICICKLGRRHLSDVTHPTRPSDSSAHLPTRQPRRQCHGIRPTLPSFPHLLFHFLGKFSLRNSVAISSNLIGIDWIGWDWLQICVSAVQLAHQMQLISSQSADSKIDSYFPFELWRPVFNLPTLGRRPSGNKLITGARIQLHQIAPPPPHPTLRKFIQIIKNTTTIHPSKITSNQSI